MLKKVLDILMKKRIFIELLGHKFLYQVVLSTLKRPFVIAAAAQQLIKLNIMEIDTFSGYQQCIKYSDDNFLPQNVFS